MAKFLFIYRESTESRAKPSPEEMQKLAAAWGIWMQKFSSAIVPGGDGVKPSGRVLKAGLVTDGPYVEAKEVIVSFTIIKADNFDAALAIARACPVGLLYAGGVTAISRWLSGATPPVRNGHNPTTPVGVAASR